jgi:pimeloyl-ACP methyl ester carboxylesterase
MKNEILSLFIILISLSLFLTGCKSKSYNSAVSSDGVQINFDVKGNGEPALIFVHGWSNNRSIWDNQISYFSNSYKVVAVDLPGFGKSGNNRKSWTISSFGDDIISLVKELELDKVVLIGFSMGGPVVIEAGKKMQDQTAGIVLVDALQDVERQTPPEALIVVDSIYMDLVNNPTIEKMTPFFRKNKDASFERILAMINRPKTGWKESLHSNFHWLNNECIESLKKIKSPVIAINSEMMPTNSEAFRKYVPSFKANIISDAGHVLMWDAPDEFNRLLEESIREFMEIKEIKVSKFLNNPSADLIFQHLFSVTEKTSAFLFYCI